MANVHGKKRPVTVIGAGFSGLVSAFYLSRAGFQVEVIEERDRPGGMISTVRTPFGLVETAANGLLNSARVEELFGLLGLTIAAPMPTARRRFIYRGRKLRRWPIGLFSTMRLLGFLAQYALVRKRVAPKEGESIRTWATRVMGREAAQYLVEAALQGIYAGDPQRMSARLVFARFFNRPNGPRLRRPQQRGTVAPPDGMGELIEKLKVRLQEQGVRFLFGHRYEPLTKAPMHPYVIATPPHEAGRLLERVDLLRANELKKIEAIPIVSATVAFREAPPEVRGFGCLFPPADSRRALGVLMNDCIFSHRVIKGSSETWILGGARADGAKLLAMSDREIIELAAEERQEVLNATGDSIGAHISRWPAALPHYTLEHEKRLPELKGLRQNVVLIGNYLGAIGLANILELAARLPEEIDAKAEWLEGRSL